MLTKGVEGVTNKFAEMIAFKVGGGNSMIESAAYAGTYCAVIEAAELIGLGTNFAKLDMTGFTLAQIKKAVERIEKKVNVLIDTPMKMSFDYVKSLIGQIENKNNEMAFKTADKLGDKAMEA